MTQRSLYHELPPFSYNLPLYPSTNHSRQRQLTSHANSQKQPNMPRSVTAPTPRLHLLPSQHREIAKKLANYIPPKSLNPQRGEDKFLESIWELMVRMDAERREIEEAWRDDSSLDEDELEEIRRMRKDVERMVRREQELGRVYMEMGLDDDDEEDGKGAEGYEGGDEGEGEEGDGESGEGEEGEEEKGEEEVGDKLASAAALALAAKYHGKVRVLHSPYKSTVTRS